MKERKYTIEMRITGDTPNAVAEVALRFLELIGERCQNGVSVGQQASGQFGAPKEDEKPKGKKKCQTSS